MEKNVPERRFEYKKELLHNLDIHLSETEMHVGQWKGVMRLDCAECVHWARLLEAIDRASIKRYQTQ